MIGTLFLTSFFMCLCTANITSKNNVRPGITAIPAQGVVNDNIASLLALAWCQNPEKVKEAFKSKTGLEISSGELIVLAKAHQSGSDIKKYNINFLDILKGIDFTQAERDKAVCTI